MRILLLIFTLCHFSYASRPNFLFIVSEDNGPDLGCYGNQFVTTPHLDQLAANGVRFDRAWVPQAGCSQSRAALLTGLYPHQNGQIGLATWKFRLYREDTPNMIRSLKEGGYRTGLLGKLHVNPKEAFPFDFHEIRKSNFDRKNQQNYIDEAAKFIDSCGDIPFFLSVNFPDAHRPFLRKAGGRPAVRVDPELISGPAYYGVDTPELRKDTADYYTCMNRLDELVGELLQTLKETGHEQDTVVVYLGDHGADLLRGKRTCLEGGMRVPLIVRFPGGNRGQTENRMVSTLDLLPTVLELARCPAITDLPGRSLVPLLDGSGVSSWRTYLFGEYNLHSAHNYFPQRCVRGERYKLIENLQPKTENPGYSFTIRRFYPGLQADIDSGPASIRRAYETMRRPPRWELYDLQADPHEFANLAESPEHQEQLNRLQRELSRWRTETADPMRDPQNVKRLKAEIDASVVDGTPQKDRLELTYPDYFFSR